MRLFLDTNIIIYALKNEFPAIREHFRSVPAQSIAIPTVVLAEIEYGARKSRNYAETIRRYSEFTNTFESVPFSSAAAMRYGELWAHLERTGTLIGANDLMIASIALAEDATLITHNTREFECVPGLTLQDWTV